MTSTAVALEPWYSEHVGFFGPRYLREYATWTTPEITGQQVRFVTELLRRASVRTVLDLACGNGRHAFGLSEEGFEVAGLDVNRSMLDAAESTQPGTDGSPGWVQADMRQLPFNQHFDAIVSLFTSFGFFDHDRQNAIVLEQVAQSLSPSGQFILDVMNRGFVLQHFEEEETSFGDDQGVYTHRRSFDPATERFTHERVRINRHGDPQRWTSIVRLYTFDQLQELFATCGLTIVDSYGGYQFEPMGIAQSRMILVGEKKS